jgi:hypothetical protein
LVDLIGKGRHIRTVPVPDWVKAAVDDWTGAAAIVDGRLFRCLGRNGVSGAERRGQYGRTGRGQGATGRWRSGTHVES